MRDLRTPGQRRHDALLTALRLLFASGTLPNAGGVATMLVLTMDADHFATDSGVAATGHGYPVPVPVAKRWLDPEARVLLTLLSKTKAIVAYSTKQRLFSATQRWAMFARDRGCSYPGCDARLAWLDGHHVTDWRHHPPHRRRRRHTRLRHPPRHLPADGLALGHARTADPTGYHPAGSTPNENHNATTSTTGNESADAHHADQGLTSRLVQTVSGPRRCGKRSVHGLVQLRPRGCPRRALKRAHGTSRA